MSAAVNGFVIPVTFRCMRTHAVAETLRITPNKVRSGGVSMS
jgi:hypothetical protein